MKKLLIILVLLCMSCGYRTVLVRNPYMPMNAYNFNPYNFDAEPYLYFPVVVPIYDCENIGFPNTYDFSKMEPVYLYE